MLSFVKFLNFSENVITLSTKLMFVGDTQTFTCVGQQPSGVDLPPTISPFINGKEVFNGVLSGNGLQLEVEFQATSNSEFTCQFLYAQINERIVVKAQNLAQFTVLG